MKTILLYILGIGALGIGVFAVLVVMAAGKMADEYLMRDRRRC